MAKDNKRITLVLGGGAARGWSHIGVIQALEEAGFVIERVIGTSIGALVGVVYASGNLAGLHREALAFDWKRTLRYLDLVFPRSGLINGRKINGFVAGLTRVGRIEQLGLPFAAVATDLATGAEVVLDQGNLQRAVRASIAIPGLFTPVYWRKRLLVDGGLVNPVPVSVARQQGATYVVGVDLNSVVSAAAVQRIQDKLVVQGGSKEAKQAADMESGVEPLLPAARLMENLNRKIVEFLEERDLRLASSEKRELPSIYEVLVAAINIVEKQITEARLASDPPDLLIRPPVGHVRLLEFDRAEETIRLGYEATRKALASS